MKRQPFFLLRWWRGLMLQTRLFLAFTLLFGFCILSLSLLLNNVIQMIRINQETQDIFEQNRMATRLRTVMDQYQLALQSYENSETDRSLRLSQQALRNSEEQISRSLSQLELALNLSEEEQAQLDQFKANNQKLSDINNQVIQAVTAQDWNKVLELDVQTYTLVEQMYQVADHFQATGQTQLEAAKAEADTFSWVSLIATLVLLPAFLLLAVLVALVIYRQINQPLSQLSEASQSVMDGKFQPQQLEKLTARGDEIGAMAQQFIQMAASVSERTNLLQQEADAIRTKIR